MADFPPRGARRMPPVAATEAGIVESRMAGLIRGVYERERSSYETFLVGQRMAYKAPKSYRGSSELRYHGEAMVVEAARASVWEKLSRYFLDNAIDAELYIRTQFEPESLKLLRPPEPGQLISASRLQLYREARASQGAVIAQSLASQRSVAAAEVGLLEAGGDSTADACAYVIVDESIEISPLFRYCLARSMTGERFQELAGVYLDRAMLQFCCYRDEYEQHWQAYLPCGFALMADRLYKAFVRR